MKINLFLMLGFLTSLSVISSSHAAGNADPIKDVDLKSYILQFTPPKELMNYCIDNGIDPINWINVQYIDFNKDGYSEAIVEASSCAMGNGGADFIKIFSMSSTQKLVELKINDEGVNPSDLHYGQGWTPRLTVEDDQLIRWYIIHPKDLARTKSKSGWKKKIFYILKDSEFFIHRIEETRPK